jgi:hypothetical protein
LIRGADVVTQKYIWGTRQLLDLTINVDWEWIRCKGYQGPVTRIAPQVNKRNIFCAEVMFREKFNYGGGVSLISLLLVVSRVELNSI